MKEVINIQETTREKKQYVRPQITMIPILAECTLLAASGKEPGDGNFNPIPDAGGDDDEGNG